MDNKCPLCGKETQEGEVFCQDCQDIAKYSDSIELDSQKKKDGNPVNGRKYKNWDEPDYSPKKSKKNIIVVAVLVFLCLTAGTVGSYIFLQDKQSLDTEMAYWQKCAAEGTQLSLSKYLVQYPEGQFSEDAKLGIERLKLKEEQEWLGLKQAADIESYEAYVDKNPNSPYLSEIEVVLDSLYWVDALSKNTISSYKVYIEKVNSQELLGRYDSLAFEKYDYLINYKEIDEQELAKLKSLLSAFFKDLSTQEYQKVQQYMQPVLSSYYKRSNVTRSDVIKLIHSDLKEQKIKSIKQMPDFSNLEGIVDTNKVYFMTVPLKKEITFLDKKRKGKIELDTVKLEFSPKFQLQAVYK